MALPNILLKNGVVILGAHFLPHICKILHVARETAPLLVDNNMFVTSANDGIHMTGSLHYTNKAFDIRIKNIKNYSLDFAAFWRDRIKLKLGEDYDVILEKDHLHIEYQPKNRIT